jgi:tRNA threonylcarbamoyladenosine biosynthesis protein TsaB
VTVNDGFCTLARAARGAFRATPMPSLRHLAGTQAPLLLIDAASSLVQVGWLETDPAAARWATSESESGVGVFACLAQLGRSPDEAAAFVFCEGPGSILGVRTAAMALRTWRVLRPRPCYAYSSLAVVAHALDQEDVPVIADARRDSWHVYQRAHGLRRRPSAELTGDLVTPEGFRNWTPLPAGTRRVPYTLATLLPQVADHDLFRVIDSPDAFLHEEPSYVTWTPAIHRAPV